MSTMTLDTMFRPTAVLPAVVRPARPRSTVRLTRRGRVVVFLAALFLVLVAGVLLAAGGSVATGEQGAATPTRVVQVSSGDTLWDIAATVAGEGDVRAMMDKIESLNALESGMVTIGQRLLVPTE